jgi:hypothetical protein
VEDLQFRLQLLDRNTSALLQILSTFQGAVEYAHIENFSRNEHVLPTEGGDLGQAMHMDREVATTMGLHVPSPGGDTFPDTRLDQGNSEADMQMEWRGTPVKEDP